LPEDGPKQVVKNLPYINNKKTPELWSTDLFQSLLKLYTKKDGTKFHRVTSVLV